MREKALGPDHPDLAAWLYRQAVSLAAQVSHETFPSSLRSGTKVYIGESVHFSTESSSPHALARYTEWTFETVKLVGDRLKAMLLS